MFMKIYVVNNYYVLYLLSGICISGSIGILIFSIIAASFTFTCFRSGLIIFQESLLLTNLSLPFIDNIFTSDINWPLTIYNCSDLKFLLEIITAHQSYYNPLK